MLFKKRLFAFVEGIILKLKYWKHINNFNIKTRLFQ